MKININDLNLHEVSYNMEGELKKLNFENEFNFIDFANSPLTDEEYEMLSSFTFNTIVSNNRHAWYLNNMYFEINQINYGIKHYDIRSEEDLIDELLECVELEGDNDNVNLFVEAIDNFIDHIYNLEDDLFLKIEEL